MNPSELLRAFNAFEARTRGTDIWPYRVGLEPAFSPILAAQRVGRRQLDDSRKPGLLSRLRGVVATAPETAPTLISATARASLPSDLFEMQLLLPEPFTPKAEPSTRLLAALRSLGSRLSYEVIATSRTVSIQLVGDSTARSAASAILRSYFPDLRVREVPSVFGDVELLPDAYWASVHLGLREQVFFPLRNDTRFDLDPLIDVVNRVDELSEDEIGALQVMFEPAGTAWGAEVRSFVEVVDDVSRVLPRIERKFAEPSFAVVLRAVGMAATQERAYDIAGRIAGGVHLATRTEENELEAVDSGVVEPDDELFDILDRECRRTGMLLSLSELASLVHLPAASIRSVRLLRPKGRTKRAPETTEGHSLVLGINEHDGETQAVSLSDAQRSRHVYVIGSSGTGKSTLLLSMVAQDVAQGNGFAILDPHGDLIDDVLSLIPQDRAESVVLFDPADEDFPVGFNILSAHSELERTLLASDLVSIFKRLSTSFGDVMVSILGNAALAFLESPGGGTLIDLRNFLVDESFRRKVLSTVRDSEIASYWTREFPLLKGVPHAPVLTRLNTFLRPKLIRRMVAQKQDRLDFRRLMDRRMIFLGKLSQGAIGEDNSHLLGSLLVSKIAQAAMSRQNIETEKREPYACYIDEFHHFVTPSIATILSGARKYGLGLVLAHQDSRQLKSRNEDVASGVLSNAATRVVFRVGDHDARMLADGFSYFEAKDLQSLDVGNAIVRVERADSDFNLRVHRLDPVDSAVAAERRLAVQEISRARYATPAADVDALLQPETKDDPEAAPERVEQRVSAKKPGQRSQNEPPTNRGRGGTQHQYLQDLVARLAKSRGFAVSIEKEVLEGHGYVDVVLEGYGISIAVEISVTTKIDHEIANLTKCLAAGFDFVVFLSSDAETRDLARAEMTGVHQKHVHVTSPGSLGEFLDQFLVKKESSEPKAPPPSSRDVENDPNAALDTTQAAAYLGLAVQTLAKMRTTGESPPFEKVNRKVIYRRSDLDAWLATRKRRSTSDPGPGKRR